MGNITRFAPSPTGKAHIGNIRTALFDYLAAKSSGGKFLLRIEDTDRERFVPEAVDYIHQALAWLGLKYDGEVVYQSNRLDLYQSQAKELLKNGSAYRCFCTPKRLAQLKEDQEKAGKAPVYDRHCLSLSEEDIAAKEKSKISYVIRFKIPLEPKEISWKDKIRDEVNIETNILEDFIILKSDGWPTYNFANIIDDHEQKINLVIRGEEFVPSTPKHILLYQAFGWHSPDFAHMPLTLGKDRQKLSKRHGDTSILDYKTKGFLPEALVNFLVLLGWNPGRGSTEEIFSLRELEKTFKVEDINKASAIFDPERLLWMNGVWIRKLTLKELVNRLIEFDPKYKKIDRGFFEKIVQVEQARLKTLAEFAEISRFYFKLPKYPPKMLIFKKSSPEASKYGLKAILEQLERTDWSNMKIGEFDRLLSRAVSDNKLDNADVFWPVRFALSGEEKSPSPAELLWVLGKEESIVRLKKSLQSLK